jgi:G protein-coupled receptor GPR1
MAIHSALQVFRPATSSRNDGLYPHRAYIYAGAFILPLLMSALAFVNPHYGYLAQGAFCSLPLRPFWYRLALAWIPRYVISIVILGLACAIYAHVGWEFRRFGDAERGREVES